MFNLRVLSAAFLVEFARQNHGFQAGGFVLPAKLYLTINKEVTFTGQGIRMTLQTSGFYEAEKLNLHTQTITKNAGLKECVQASLKQYFNILGADDADNMYRLVMDQVEPALLEEVLERCNGNQSRAAKVLGLNRNTLRKKLQQFDLI